MRKSIIPITFLLSLLVAACGNEAEVEGTGATLRVTANLGGTASAPATRANGSTWEQDAIGVSETTSGSQYANVKYTTTSQQETAEFSTSEVFTFPDAAATYSFSAYGPYQSSVNATTPTVTLSTAKQNTRDLQKAFDYIFATGSATAASPMLNFTFAHSLAKLTVRIATSSTMKLTDLTAGSYGISGITHDGTFDTSTGSTSLTTNTSASTTSWSLSDNALKTEGTSDITFSAILLPQTVTAPKLSAVIGGTLYTASVSDIDLQAGKNYTILLVADYTSLSVASCTVTDWDAQAEETELHPIMEDKIQPVDLGLPSGLLWANMNLGAPNEQSEGSLYQWGDPEPHSWSSGYNGAGYKWKDSAYDGLPNMMYSKYNQTDKLITLEAEDDAATQTLGEKWHIPDSVDWKELVQECQWMDMEIGGQKVWKIVGKNFKYIILPQGPYYNENVPSNQNFSNGVYYWTRNLANPSALRTVLGMGYPIEYVNAMYHQYAVMFTGEKKLNQYSFRTWSIPIRAVKTP